jgi:hypothetical protein
MKGRAALGLIERLRFKGGLAPVARSVTSKESGQNCCPLPRATSAWIDLGLAELRDDILLLAPAGLDMIR